MFGKSRQGGKSNNAASLRPEPTSRDSELVENDDLLPLRQPLPPRMGDLPEGPFDSEEQIGPAEALGWGAADDGDDEKSWAEPDEDVVGAYSWTRAEAQPAPPPASAPMSEGKRLIVGREICLSGEIKTCDQLVVEGRVEANLTDSRRLEIAASGFFKGAASIEEADISGQYQGDLVVTGCLKVRNGGRVEGNVRYGELEIERGGVVLGSVDVVAQEGQRVAEAVQAPKATVEAKGASPKPAPASQDKAAGGTTDVPLGERARLLGG